MKEKVMTVCFKDGVLCPAGWSWRSCIHSYPRIPHASVLIIPQFAADGHVVMHKRSLKKDVSPGLWDFCGGHVRYDEEVTDAVKLERHLEAEARREGVEEILCGRTSEGESWRWSKLGNTGELLLDSELNLEFGTVFIVSIPAHATIGILDGTMGGGCEPAVAILVDPYEKLRGWFLGGTLRCAEGATAIFNRFQALSHEA